MNRQTALDLFAEPLFGQDELDQLAAIADQASEEDREALKGLAQ